MEQVKQMTIVLLFFSLGGVLKAQEIVGGNFSLQQSIEYALKHSPSYLNAALDEKNAEYRRKEIRGLGLPQVSGSIDVKDYIEIPTSLIPGDFVGQPGTYLPVKFGTK